MTRFSFAFFLVLLVSGLAADELDDLFVQAGNDIVSQPSVAAVAPAPLVRVTGSTKFVAGVAVGQQDWGSPLDGSGLYTMEGSLSFDARPDPRIRAWAVIDTTSTGVSFTTPSISEFFFDYTMADAVIFRIGKQSLSWGQGRLYNPADLVSDVDEGISFKAFMPFFGQSLTIVALAKGGDLADPTNPSWRELSYAAQLSGDLGPFGWGLAGRTRPGLDLIWAEQKVTGFLKTVIAGADVVTELLWAEGVWTPLCGVFWERVDPTLKIQVETTDQRLSFAFKTAASSVKPGFQWVQYYKDGSGVLTAGVEWPIDGLTTITFGLPVTYGKPQSLAMAGSDDPSKRFWLAGVKLSLNANF